MQDAWKTLEQEFATALHQRLSQMSADELRDFLNRGEASHHLKEQDDETLLALRSSFASLKGRLSVAEKENSYLQFHIEMQDQALPFDVVRELRLFGFRLIFFGDQPFDQMVTEFLERQHWSPEKRRLFSGAIESYCLSLNQITGDMDSRSIDELKIRLR